MKKRISSIILTLMLALCLLSASALAAESGFGISMGGTQLEPGKYYRTNADGNAEETTAENYEIYFIANDTNVYTLTIKEAAEHEITFGSATSLAVVDYGQTPIGNRVIYTPGASDTVMVQTMDNNVADGTFAVLTAGKLNAALAPDQSFTLAYQDEDGSFTNARHFHASADNNNEGEQYFAYFLLFGYPGIDDSITVSGGDSVTIDDVLYTYHDFPTRAMTIHFSMDLSPYITADHFGELTVRADRAYTDVLNGYDFVAGYPTKAVFNVEKPQPCLISGTIALDQGEVVIANTAYITGDNAVVSIDETTGIATVDGSAVVGGALEITGNPGDDDYRALAEVAPNGDITLHNGAAYTLSDTTISIFDNGTLTLAAGTEFEYSDEGNYLLLEDGILTTDGFVDFVSLPNELLDFLAVGGFGGFTLEYNDYTGAVLSGLTAPVSVSIGEGGELVYDIGDDTILIRAQSQTNILLQTDGTILENNEPVSDADGEYLVGAAHQSFTLGGLTVFGNPNGIEHDEATGVLQLTVPGTYQISGSGTASIEAYDDVDIILHDTTITAPEGLPAIYMQGGDITLDGAVTLEGSLWHSNTEPCLISGSGSLTVRGGSSTGIEGNIMIENVSVTATGASGVLGDVTLNSGSLTATGTTHAGISGSARIHGGTLIVTGGSGGNSDDGEPGIDGDVSLYGGNLTVTGGKAVTGSNGNGGTGVTGIVTVEDGTAKLTGGTGSGTGSHGAGIRDEENLIGNTDKVTIADGKPTPAPAVAIRYNVTTAAENGTISIGTRYKRGEPVTFTVTPDEGYTLSKLTVARQTGRIVPFEDNGDGTYTFEMPAANVVVNAEFVLAFEDITPDHQFYEAIEWVWQNDLMLGISETTFDRIMPITRQQVWRILARILTGEDPGSMAAAKEWAVTQGITDDTNPGTAATREEFVTMLWTAYGKPAADTSALTAFSDASTISADAAAAMAWAVEQGIVGGYEDGTLRPAASTSRGAFAAILFRYLAK